MNQAFGKWREEDRDMPPSTTCPYCRVPNLYWVRLTSVEGWRLSDSQGKIHDCGHYYPQNIWEIQ